MPIINRVADLADDIAAWRRDFHEHPELLFEAVLHGSRQRTHWLQPRGVQVTRT